MWYRRLVGSTARFAVEISFADDPDGGRFASPAQARSWGSLRLYVQGRELTAAVGPQGDDQGGAWWYLLPILEWVTHAWDALLHETRFPVPVTGVSTAVKIARAASPPVLPEAEADMWQDATWGFYERHAIVSARDGGILPNVAFSRTGDEVEVSWLDEDRPGGGPIRFAQQEGAALVDVEEFASVWRESLASAVAALQGCLVDPRFAELGEKIALLDHPDDVRRRQRAAWLLGLRDCPDKTLEVWQALAERGVHIDLPADAGAFCRATLPSVLFASVKPDLSIDDVARVSELFAKTRPMSPALAGLVQHETCPTSHPFKSGHALALQTRAALGRDGDPVDIEHLLQTLDVPVEPLALSDARGIRGLSLVRGDATLSAYNARSERTKRPWARAAVLAHELCHVLFDRNSGTDLAIGSGPWAPIHLERRANAFAVMFLMPERGVLDVLEHCPAAPRERVAAVAKRFGVGYRAATEHLYSLGLLDEDDRDELLDDIDGLLG